MCMLIHTTKNAIFAVNLQYQVCVLKVMYIIVYALSASVGDAASRVECTDLAVCIAAKTLFAFANEKDL